MAVAAAGHLGDESGVSSVERLEFALPSQRLGMPRVAPLVFGQDRPHSMELPMLAEQMLPAKGWRRQIPYPHE